MKRINDKWLLALRMLCAIALLSVGFAHKVPAGVADQTSAFELAAFALPDGTMPDICLSDGHTGDQDHSYAGDCEACRLSATILLPDPADTVGRRMAVYRELSFAARPITVRRLVLSPNASPRAPPAGLIV